MTPKLKCCPFCGSFETRIIKVATLDDEKSKIKMIPVTVDCNGCGTSGPSIHFKENVVKAWNERI